MKATTIKTGITAAFIAGAALSLSSCKTSKSTVKAAPSTVYTQELRELNRPLADSIFKYSAFGLDDYDLVRKAEVASASLKETLPAAINVHQMGQGIVINFPATANFKVDDYLLNENLKSNLRDLAFQLQQNQDYLIVVFGRADDTGGKAHNLQLGKMRAITAANYLRGCNLPEARFFVDSFGEKAPDFLNTNAVNRLKNRKIDILLLPANTDRLANL